MDNKRSFSSFGGPREMHDATCSECGAATKVPFKPDPSRPVFCRDCFAKKKNSRFDRPRGPRRDSEQEEAGEE
jgi:CxxC-x17-CxxC domain-containing protein